MESFKEEAVAIAQEIEGVESVLEKLRVTVMPDFYVDRLIRLRLSPASFVEKLVEIVESGGGGLQGEFVEVEEVAGGNAANTARTLASLGFKPSLICVTDSSGALLLTHFFQGLNVNLHVVPGEVRSMTTSFEILYEGKAVNLMIGFPGSLASLSFNDLGERELEVLRRSDLVGIFNWAGNWHKGTEFFRDSLAYIKSEGGGLTYIDIADPRPRIDDLPRFVEEVVLSRYADYISVNEYEATAIGRCLGVEPRSPLTCAVRIAEESSAQVLLHTPEFSAYVKPGGEVETAPTFRIEARVATGAGDAFNAGAIMAVLLGLTPVQTLILANSVAAYYISMLRAPTLGELRSFLLEAEFRESPNLI